MPLTGNFGPWPLCSQTCTFLCHLLCQKIQGLSYQYRHFKLFSISTGRNKPPGEISQSPRPRQLPQIPVTHTVCVPGCGPLVRPHTSGPHSLIPLAIHEYLREKSGKHHLFLRSKHPSHPLHQYSWAQPSAWHPRAARGGSVIKGPRGARRPPGRMHALGLGTGKSRGGPSALATPYSMFRLNVPLRKRRPSSPPETGGDVLGGEERHLLPSRFQERYAKRLY